MCFNFVALGTFEGWNGVHVHHVIALSIPRYCSGARYPRMINIHRLRDLRNVIENIYLHAPSRLWFFGNYESKSIQSTFIDQCRAVDGTSGQDQQDHTKSQSNNVAVLSSRIIINLAHICLTCSSST